MEIGTQIGSYRIDGLLGQGGMAEVWKAWHLNLHCYHALKMLPLQMTFDKNLVERFLKEARNMAGLQHPNIATIHTVSEAECPQPYFAMELIEGGDLSDLLAERGVLPLSEALPILQQIGAALDYAHSRNLIHRDVKPGNVLLKADGHGGHTVKVVDFGIARAQEETGGKRLTKTGMIVGTPEYMSPEQGGSGAIVDHHTDLYSLGVIAYEMLCGQPPFRASGETSTIAVIMDHVRTDPPDPLSLNPSLGANTAQALLVALAKDPAARPNSGAELVSTLQGTIKARRVPRAAASPHAGSTPSMRKRRVSPALLIGVPLLVGAALVGYGLGNKDDGEMIVHVPGSVEVVNEPNAASDSADKPTPPKPSTNNPQKELKEMVEEWRQARQSRDLDRLTSLYSSSATTSDGKAETVGSMRETLYQEKFDQPRVEIGVSNIRLYVKNQNQALVVFQQHFKGWGENSSRNWESWGTKKMTVWRSEKGWKITRDDFKRDTGHRF